MSTTSTGTPIREEIVPTQRVQPGTPAPYESGDRVWLWVQLIGASHESWVRGVVLTCDQPHGARRFVCSVAIAKSIHSAYLTDRVYCNEDGSGDEILPAEGTCGSVLLREHDQMQVAVCTKPERHSGAHKQLHGPGWVQRTPTLP